MKWKRMTIKTITEAEDLIISALSDIGIEGVEIEDRQPLTEEEKAGMFVDIMPPEQEDDGVALLHCYLDEDTDTAAAEKAVREILEEIRTYAPVGEGSITFTETEDKDWINNWKEYFHQFYVDDILIVPSWEEVKEEDRGRLILHIDPGTAFGTGMHETTQLVIRQLRKYVKNDSLMLDVGTGSGILGIVALKTGASKVYATDLDPCALNAIEENLASNDIPESSFCMRLGNLIDDRELKDWAGYEKYDIVTANILADVLVELTPEIVRHMKKGGVYITSGILDVKEDAVAEAVERAGLRILEVTRQGEWVCITAGKD